MASKIKALYDKTMFSPLVIRCRNHIKFSRSTTHSSISPLTQVCGFPHPLQLLLTFRVCVILTVLLPKLPVMGLLIANLHISA